MGSGNLGLVYLMEERRRLTLEEMNERHPDLIPALRNHPHVGWLLVRSSEHGPVVLGGSGTRYLADGRVEGDDPARGLLAQRPAAPPPHRRVHPRRRHHDRQLLRPGARDRLRLRGADLVPRRHRRPADAAVHPSPRRAEGARGGDRRRSRRPRDLARLEAPAQRRHNAGVLRDPCPASTSGVIRAGAHVLFYALIAAASPLALTATLVVIRSDRPRTNSIAFLTDACSAPPLRASSASSSARPRRTPRLARTAENGLTFLLGVAARRGAPDRTPRPVAESGAAPPSLPGSLTCALQRPFSMAALLGFGGPKRLC